MVRMAPHTVVLHGHELSYVDSGAGPVVLFIHGILGSQRQWARLVDKMDDDHRVLAGMHVNLWDTGLDAVRELIRSGKQVDPARLADTSVELSDV